MSIVTFNKMMTSKARTVALAAVTILAVAGCADSSADSTSTPPTTTPSTAPSSSTTTTVAATTSSPTEAPPPTTEPPLQPLEIDRLENGLPATFVAVTDDWAAVEIDTATGEVIRFIGQGETPEVAEEEGLVSGAIDLVVRSSDGEWLAVSECCEPAAGYITFLRPGDAYPSERPAPNFAFAWSASPSPFDGRFATAGFGIGLVVDGAASVVIVDQEPLALMQASGVIAWSRDGRRIHWVSNSFSPEGGALLLSATVDGDQVEPDVVELPWVGERQWLDGIGSQATGSLVGFLNTMDGAAEPRVVATEGVVFDASGQLIATFPVQTGSLWGGYDPSGRVLIYTDGDQVVRWQGLGQAGELAAGYVHASW